MPSRSLNSLTGSCVVTSGTNLKAVSRFPLPAGQARLTSEKDRCSGRGSTELLPLSISRVVLTARPFKGTSHRYETETNISLLKVYKVSLNGNKFPFSER